MSIMEDIIAPPPDLMFHKYRSEQVVSPKLFAGDSLLELCNSFWERSPGASEDVQPYLRGCKWSPDGTCCLSVVNHDGLHIMELPRDLYEGCPPRDRMITLLPAIIHIKEGGLVYDFCWYPKMNSYIPETCSWITTKKNAPIQMWDAYDGSLRCSYRGFNAVDEMEPAISITFTNEGQQIVGGYKKCLRTFEVERPGRDFIEYKLKSPVSSMASTENFLAVGSWDTNIRLFSIKNMGTYKSIGNMHWHTGGITHLKFTPDKTKLVSGARKDDNLLVWDLRYFKTPLNVLKRCVSTNQRIYFDISACGRYLVSGGTDGVLRVWDEKYTKWTGRFDVKDCVKETATFRFRLHQDCCNSVSIHPTRPILATGSGQFHFVDPAKAIEEEIGSSDDDNHGQAVQIQNPTQSNITKEKQFQYQSQVNVLPCHTAVEVCTEANKFDSIDHTQFQKREEMPTEAPKMDSTNEVLILLPEHDIAEEPPPKKLALKTTVTSPAAITKMETSEEFLCNKAKLGFDSSTDGFQPNTNENIDKDIVEMDIEEINIAAVPTDESKTYPSIKINEDDILDVRVATVSNELAQNIIENSSSQLQKGDINIQANSPKLKEAKVNDADDMAPKISKIKNTIIKSKIGAAKISDDCSPEDENEMKYSSFAENNLTFWWIAQVSEV